MLFDDVSTSPFPSFTPSTLYSFYPYPISSRDKIHQSLRGIQAPPTGQSSRQSQQEARDRAAKACERAARRALMGKRPAGVAVGREAEDLSEEEDVLDHAKSEIDQFGHRFLLPIGRRLTHMEMEAAPSPTPSDAGDERRQEDRNVATPVSPLGQNGQAQEVNDEPEPVDLDAELEDLDDEGNSGEPVNEDDAEDEGEEGDMEED